MKRREFSNYVKAQAAIRAKGRCENCTARLMTGGYHYDHRVADALGGDNSEDNCQLLCKTCHDLKTRKADVPNIAKAKRREKKHLGIKKPRTITRWRKMDGTAVFATRER